jgi:hypothetical protein
MTRRIPWLVVGALCLPRLAVAQQVPEPPEAKKAPEGRKLLAGLKVSVYANVLPFTEYIKSENATPPGFTGGADQVPLEDYTGFDAKPRFRMTPGTSNIGFRGTWALFDQLALTWQIESGVPIDGTGPPNTIASRNSHIGFTGDWGTLIFGNWDTPWKTATLVTINPIRGGFVPDYTSILGTPGFGVSALNSTSVFLGSISNAAFYRREPNSFQYWSPTLAGFSLRLDYALNEGRPSQADVVGGRVPNPYLLSGYVGFDGGGLRVRYAYELHEDYFGMSQLGGSVPAPSDEVTSSTDQGHQGTLQYVLTISPKLRTRLVGTAEILNYKASDTTPDAINEYSRPAFYALLEQSFFGHRVWAAYGHNFAGECRRVGGGACSTTGLSARLMTLGYMFELNEDLNLHLVGYRLYNDASSRHSTYVILEPDAPGADLTAVGLGMFYAFDVGLYP